MKHRYLALILLSVCWVGCSETSQSGREIIFGHGMSPQHPVAVAISKLAADVDSISNGELTIRIYPSGQLGSEPKLMELLQFGTIGMTKVSANTLSNTVPAVQPLNLPYIFRNKQHRINVLKGEVGQEILDEGEKYRIHGLGFYDAGSRSLYTVDKKIDTPEDLSGMKIRVMESAVAMDLMSSLGGSPTPMSYSELYTAFQGGIVDGAENNPPSYFNSRHYEVTKYYILNEHSAVPDILIAGTHLWENLTEQEKEWLLEAVDMSIEFQWKLWETSEIEAIDAVKEAGVEVIIPDKEPFMKKVEPLYEDIARKDPELDAWIQKIKAVEG